LEELLRDIPTQCPLLHKPIAWTQEDREGNPYHPFMPSIDRIDNNKGLCLRFVVAAAALLIFCCRLRQGQQSVSVYAGTQVITVTGHSH
jgi:hypothetical protein